MCCEAHFTVILLQFLFVHENKKNKNMQKEMQLDRKKNNIKNIQKQKQNIKTS